MLIWTRARRRETETALIRRWSTSGYAVDEVCSKLGLQKRFLLVRTADDKDMFVLSYHRTRSGAMKGAENAC